MLDNVKFKDLPVIPLQATYVGVMAIHRFVGHLSASRTTLAYSQIQQKITMHKPDVSLNQTGIEKQLADSTFATRVPEDAVVLAVHRLSNRTTTWRTCILYKEDATGIIGHIELTNHHSLHSRLGYTCIKSPELLSLRVGDYLRKDTVLDDTPGNVDGLYSFGKNLNVCLASFPGVAEDAFIFNEDTFKDIKYDTIEEIPIRIMSQQVLLNVNGVDNCEKLIPEPGDIIRKDNILAVLRNIEPAIAPAQLSPVNMRTIDHVLDDIVELQSGFEGRVLDVSVIRDYDKKEYISNTFGQLDRLADAETRYYASILKSYRNVVRNVHLGKAYSSGQTRDVPCTDRTTAFLTRLSMLIERRDVSKCKIKLLHKGEELPPYNITLTVLKTRTPVAGSKFTDLSASKGVNCEEWPAYKMPVDHRGVVADVIASQTASLGRNIVGRLFSQYFDSIADNVAREIAVSLGVKFKSRKRMIKKTLIQTDPKYINGAWDYVMGMYRLACPTQYERLVLETDLRVRMDYLIDCIHYGGAILTQTVDNVFGKAKAMVRALEGSPYAPAVKPVTYVNHNNKTVTTKNPIRIAPIYMIPLERDASESSATDTIRLQSQLFTSSVSKSDKHRAPMSTSNVALLGIDESTIIASAVKPEGMAEFSDRLNSPKTHAVMVQAILDSDNPTGEHTLVDRTKHGFGTTSANRTITHILACYGSELYYTDDED